METKQCNDCHEIKKVNEFDKSKSGRQGLNNTCKECRSKNRKKLDFSRTLNDKKCLSCNIILSPENFSSDKTSSDGLQTYCKECHKQKTYQHLSNFDPYMRNLFRNLKNNALKRNIEVEIILDDLYDIYKQQNGLCAYSGIKMTHNKIPTEEIKDFRSQTTNPYNISVDRIDSKLKYTKENIQLVTVSVNHMKWNLEEQIFLDMCNMISNFQKIKT